MATRNPTEPLAEHRGDGVGINVVRPFLLSGGLALIWFVQFQDVGVEGDVPAWGIAVVLVIRLLVDFVGAWLAVSIIRLAFAFGRLALTRLRTG